MNKSRTAKAVLLIFIIVIAFVGISVGISLVWERDGDSVSWTGFLEQHNKIGVINLEGQIISADDLLKDLRKFQKKSSVKAIVLRINSPGGAVAPAQELYREIAKIRKKKPVVASMETVAASAAYYVASNTDRIVCSSGTITGSIGVIMMLPDIQKAIDRIGINVKIIKAGKYKDIGSVVRPLTTEEQTILETFASEIHEQFIMHVAQARKGKIEEEKLREISDGRFFTGERAKELGLVDSIGNFYDAVRIASELGGIKVEPELLYPKKKWENYLDIFMESASRGLCTAIERSGLIRPVPSIQ